MEEPLIKQIPRHIQIDDYIFTYKDELINNFFCYRCKYRQSCKVLIKVALDEIKKFIKDSDYKIKYKISSSKKNHS